MSQSKASKIAAAFTGDPKGLPRHLQRAIVDVDGMSQLIARRVELAEALHAERPDHDLALEPGSHDQVPLAYRYEEVEGEIIEVRKETPRSRVRLIYRPDLRPAAKPDPALELETLLRSPDELGE